MKLILKHLSLLLSAIKKISLTNLRNAKLNFRKNSAEKCILHDSPSLLCSVYMATQSMITHFIAEGSSGSDDGYWSGDPVSTTYPFGFPSGADMEDVRLPKKRRYCGEDSSRHAWDNRGLMSTEPPTPILLEQAEPVDSEAVFPRAIGTVRTSSVAASEPKVQPRMQLPHGAVSHRKVHKSRSAEGTPSSSAARVKWLEADDRQLIDLVSEHGSNWPLIASKMEGRTSKQVKERWTNQLDPTISTDPWTAEDDQQLVELIRELGHSWCEIARLMKGRTESMVKNRFHANLRKRFGPHIFDRSVPLPPLTFKPKSVKSKKTVLSDEVRKAASLAAQKASNMMSLSALPMATNSFSPSSETTNSGGTFF